MSKLLIYYAHPGNRHSHTNARMAMLASTTEGITFVDLYAKYPRFNIDADAEQALLQEHDVILFQFPLFWYSTPSIVKEWFDLVLEYGFAYGPEGNNLAGKRFMIAITTGGDASAYSPSGYQNFPLRTFLTPIEQTARLCNMEFCAPYVLHGSLKAPDDGRSEQHAQGYQQLIAAIRDNQYNFTRANKLPLVTYSSLPITEQAQS